MIVTQLEDADIMLVTTHGDHCYCKLHGAMNKVSKVYWRCVHTYKLREDGSMNENACRAGCKEVKR